MLTLPPPQPTSRTDRSGDRRVRNRRARSAEAHAEDGFAPEPALEADGPEPVLQRMKPRSRGRRKTDHEQPRAEASGPATSRAARPHAPLVAQLIATALGVEQTRVRRRGTLDQATALYGKKAERPKRSRGEA